MKHLLEMNHFLPTLKTGNAKKSNVQLDTYEIPENIKEFFSRNNRKLSMILEIHEDGTVDVNGDIAIWSDDLIDKKFPIKFGYVSGNFNCSNINVKTLEGCPIEVGRDFNCHSNELTSLEGCTQKVGGGFYCGHNQLISLEGCPQEVRGYFSCTYNKLTSLEGCPQEVRGNFYCYDNSGNFTEDDVRQYCNVKGKIKV